jgi:ADP-ribose pyrophosphatase
VPYSRRMSEKRHEQLRETLVERETLHAGGYISLRLDVVTDAGGRAPDTRGGRPSRRGGNDRADRRSAVLLVRQYRHAVGDVCLELPAGTLDRGPPTARASRPSRPPRAGRGDRFSGRALALLARFFTAPGFATEEMHLYLATDLAPIEGYDGPAPDERLELETIHWSDALQLAESGELRDAKTLVGVLWLYRLAETGAVTQLKAS